MLATIRTAYAPFLPKQIKQQVQHEFSTVTSFWRSRILIDWTTPNDTIRNNVDNHKQQYTCARHRPIQSKVRVRAFAFVFHLLAQMAGCSKCITKLQPMQNTRFAGLRVVKSRQQNNETAKLIYLETLLGCRTSEGRNEAPHKVAKSALKSTSLSWNILLKQAFCASKWRRYRAPTAAAAPLHSFSYT